MFSNLPKEINIVEVGPRDGLQNEKEIISTKDKITLVEKLAESGLKNIEITSFVHPKWTPQLADSFEVATSINKLAGINYLALVPNLKGAEKAVASNLEEIAVFMSSTESHNKKNLNRTISESLDILEETVKYAKQNNLRIRGYLSTVFGCPYEGKSDINRVKEIVKKLLSYGIYQISLGDTIGVANPKQVKEILESLFEIVESKQQLAVHFHDTMGMALANSVISLECGITTFDSSIGGMGGCPYAPGATGNVATEDLVNMLHKMKIETGVNLEKLLECTNFMQKVLNKPLNSKLPKSISLNN
ncbi:MAG: hydroxymethylglutaryl-CoA lyase [Candidatus Sericytochromatia bacterium]